MSNKPKLTVTGTRLQQQGLLFLEQTRQAGEGFVADARGASLAFGEQLSEASQKLLEQLTRSASGLGAALQKETSLWWELALQTREAYTESWVGRVEELESKAREVTQEANVSIRPAALEKRVWGTAHEMLARAQSFVEGRLEASVEGKTATRNKTTARKALAIVPKTSAKGSGRAPIRNYDELTAKDVVRRIQRLSGPQATALLDYEKGGKNRATVIRAAKQKLAAG